MEIEAVIQGRIKDITRKIIREEYKGEEVQNNNENKSPES